MAGHGDGSRGRGVRRRTLFALGGAATVAAVTSCQQRDEPRSTWNRGPDILPAGQVWAHLVPQGLPAREDASVRYGSDRPMDLAPAGSDYGEGIRSQLRQARAAGITGMQILLLEAVNSGTDFVLDWLRAAHEDTDPDHEFWVAPCFQVQTGTGAERLIREYVRAAHTQPRAARVAGELVIWLYDAPALAPEEWRRCRQALEESGIRTVMVAELRTAASQQHNAFRAEALDPYAGLFEAVWLFDDHDFLILSEFDAWARQHETAVAGGLMPGYDRRTARGGYVDARGTRLWREQWQRQQDLGSPWATVVTWNDVVEHTAVQPSTDWSTTRADLTAFFAARLRDRTPPGSEATGYLTTAQYLKAGDPLLAEGVVINGSAAPVTVQLRVVDHQQRELASSSRVRCPAGEIAAAEFEQPVGLTPGAVGYALMDLHDQRGRRLSRTRSAPVLVYAQEDPALPHPTRRAYYSISSQRAVAFERVARLSFARGGERAASSLELSARQPVRSLELLHNTWPAGLALAGTRLRYTPPRGTIVGGQTVATPDSGFTVARVITHDGRVAYSAPVHHPSGAAS